MNNYISAEWIQLFIKSLLDADCNEQKGHIF